MNPFDTYRQLTEASNIVLPAKETAPAVVTETAANTLTLDVPAMIRKLEEAHKNFKSDEDVRNFMEDLLGESELELDTDVQTVVTEAKDLSADARAASAYAATKPSASTHRLASNAHDAAAEHHEKKAEKIAKSNHTGEDDDLVNHHTKLAKQHRNDAQIHRFKAYRAKHN